MVRWKQMVFLSRSLAAPAAIAGAAAAVVLTSCSPPGIGRSAAQAGSPQQQGAPATAPKLSIVPSDGSSGVALDAPVVVTAKAGRLDSVRLLKAGTAEPLAGDLSGDGRSWRSLDGLDSRANYTVVAAA